MNEEEPVISRIKTMYHQHNRKYDERPDFLICDWDTWQNLLHSIWARQYMNFVEGSETFMGMKVAILSHTTGHTLEVR